MCICVHGCVFVCVFSCMIVFVRVQFTGEQLGQILYMHTLYMYTYINIYTHTFICIYIHTRTVHMRAAGTGCRIAAVRPKGPFGRSQTQRNLQHSGGGGGGVVGRRHAGWWLFMFGFRNCNVVAAHFESCVNFFSGFQIRVSYALLCVASPQCVPSIFIVMASCMRVRVYVPM